MKKIFCLIAALLACVALASPAFAAENNFVPSISYKDGPEIEEAKQGEEDIGSCIVVTSIPDAKNKSTDIYQEDRDLLLEVYKALSDGSMELPLDEDYVIRDLVDVSFKKTECVEPGHGHKEELAKDNTTITITFDMGLPKGVEITVMTYIDGEWVPAENVVNNGDGTITCVFEDICPVVFCVEEDYNYKPPKTGDEFGRNLPIWIAIMVVSLTAAVVLIILYRRKNKKDTSHHKHHRH